MLKTFIKILIVIGITYLVFKLPVAIAFAPEVPIEQQSVERQIVYYANLYGFDSEIGLKVAECESNFSNKAIGDSGKSKGIFQFQKETFNRHSKQMGETLDYTSAHDQIKLAMWSMSNGNAREWTTYRAIMNGGTYTFYSKQLKKTFTVYCKL